MAKFLTTVGNSYYIEQLIINSSESLTLVTPFLKLSRNLLERISDAEKEGVKITLIYGKNELAKREKDNLNTFKNVEIYFCENLHAKCYHNETSMIITSMNLYEFSERNNREMGLLIDKETDSEIFEASLKEIESIKNSSKHEKIFDDLKTSSIAIDDGIKMNPDYDEDFNFYLPSLYEILTKKYSEHKIVLESNLTLYDFPFKGVDINVAGRINFIPNEQSRLAKLKNLNAHIMTKLLPGVRCYWNYRELNIYPEKEFSPEKNAEGVNEYVSKYLSIIDVIYENYKTMNN